MCVITVPVFCDRRERVYRLECRRGDGARDRLELPRVHRHPRSGGGAPREGEGEGAVVVGAQGRPDLRRTPERMAIKYLLVVNMQGQTRVSKYCDHTLSGEEVRGDARE